MHPQNDYEIYLKPTEFIDSDSERVIEYTEKAVKNAVSDIDKAVKLYYAVRDDFMYDPYRMDLTRYGMKASTVLEKKSGFCIPKAVLLSASARVMGIPSRLGFADVKNHITSKRLFEILRTNIFAFHGFTELFLEGKWVKATPAFNKLLCNLTGVKPLEFDGINDSMFQAYDQNGNKHMEYVKYRGVFADLPYNEMIRVFRKYHPMVLDPNYNNIKGDFSKEAEAGG